jgi:hypothetical protein
MALDENVEVRIAASEDEMNPLQTIIRLLAKTNEAGKIKEKLRLKR